MKLNVLRAAAAVAVALSLQAGAVAAQQSQPQPQPEQAVAPDDTVVARVNGAEITLGDVRAAHLALPETYRSAPLSALFQPLVQQLVDRKLVVEAARASDLENDPEWRQAKQQTLERLMEQFYMLAVVVEAVTDAAVRRLYQERHAGKPGAEEVRARHILVKTEAEAREALAQIRGGAPFAEVARQRSGDGSAVQGGDLGFFTREQMVPEFSQVAFALQAGELSEPVETQFGWHLIKLEERRQSPPPELAEVRDELRQELAREALTARLALLKQKADVQIYTIDGKPKIGLEVVRPQKR